MRWDFSHIHVAFQNSPDGCEKNALFHFAYHYLTSDISDQLRNPGLSKGEFGTNEKVQDDFGGLSKQRHATVGGHAKGMLVVAWDDEREGNAEIMLRAGVRMENGVKNWPLPVTSGVGQQSNPSIVLDSEGNLHIAWVEGNTTGATT